MSRKYERALALASRRGKPSRRAYELLLEAQKIGDPRAIYALATWYLHGSPFIRKNIETAMKMMREAAKKGVASAAFDLAVSFEKGIGVSRSTKRAFEYFMQAALLGDAQSFYEVGRMYFYGIGVSRNRRLAEHWLTKAETLGIKALNSGKELGSE